MQELFETMDALFRTARKQAERIESLETRCTELERRLREHEAETTRPVLTLVEPETAEVRAG